VKLKTKVVNVRKFITEIQQVCTGLRRVKFLPSKNHISTVAAAITTAGNRVRNSPGHTADSALQCYKVDHKCQRPENPQHNEQFQVVDFGFFSDNKTTHGCCVVDFSRRWHM